MMAVSAAVCRAVRRATERGCGQSQQCFALNFDGVDDYGQLATPVVIPANTDFELEFLVKSSVDSAFAGFFAKDTATTANNFLRFLSSTQPSNMQLIFSDGSSANLFSRTSAPVVRDGNYHIVKIRRVAGVVTPTLDGVDYASTSGRNASLTIGVVGRLGGTYYSGVLGYVRINGTYWTMDQVGQSVQPSLPAGNDMTLFNTTPEQWEQIPCNLRPSENELLTPQIQQEPQDQSVIVGAAPSFTVAATVDVGTVEFQWQADTGAGFVDMPTETNATLTLPPVALINNGNLFRAQVRANGRSVVSRAALLTVNPI